ncbi:hypothetical protein [Listeria rustica]|uniref:Uncharacterized protein n=1 Tax=Listeria rustica TaxID=2713503 RepID=A0A7W1T5A4_9LIST|nr:hypothetical protein [Listeria rustica]MBA3925718.1 hypothetical protein [Listeria rustica]
MHDLEDRLKKITKMAFGLAVCIPISIVLFVALGFILALVIGIDEKNILLFIKCFMWLELVIYLINWVFCLRSFLWIRKFKKTAGTSSTPQLRLMKVVQVALALFIIPVTLPFAIILLGTANKLAHGKFSVNRLSGALHEKYIMS